MIWIALLAATAIVLVPPLWLVLRLRREGAPRRWWIAVLTLGLLGVAAGVGAGFFSEYRLDDGRYARGFPLPFAEQDPPGSQPIVLYRTITIGSGDSVWAEGDAARWLIGAVDAIAVAGALLLPLVVLSAAFDAWRRVVRVRRK